MIIVRAPDTTIPSETQTLEELLRVPTVVVPAYGFGMRLITPTHDWDLAAGPVYVLEGAGGFGAPDAEHAFRETPAFDGALYQMTRVPARKVPLPLEVSARTRDEWLEADRQLWRGLDPRSTCKFVVVAPDSTWRSLTLRYESGGDVEKEIDPALLKQSLYPLQFTAADPYWRGPTVSQEFQVLTTAAFFPGPPFAISSSAAMTTGTVNNPGDEPAWPRWVIDGPYSTATVGVGSAVVTLSTPILAGERRIIDMDPRAGNSITRSNGTRAWVEATAKHFAPIPPTSEVDLNMSITGGSTATRISLQFEPRYRRAW